MNRIVLCGVALFFAIVGIALLGGEEKANAGLFGGSSCDGSDCSGSDCCGGRKLFGHHNRCSGRERCHGGGLFSGHCSGREKCHGGLFKKHRCNGSKCNGGYSDCSGSCGGEVKELKDAPAPAPADEATPPAPAPEEKKA